MKILKQLIRGIQFIMAMMMIFALGQWLILKTNDLFNFEVTPYNLFIFSFSIYLILMGMNYLLKEKE